MPRYLDKRIKTSTYMEPIFTSCCQNGNSKFPPLIKVQTILRQFLTTPDAVSKRLRQELSLLNVVLCMAFVAANSVSRGQRRSTFNPTMIIQGTAYHCIGVLIRSQRNKHSSASVYVHNTDKVESVRSRGGNVGRHVKDSILIDL